MASVTAQDAPALKSEQEQFSYALGMNQANSLRKHSIKVDADLFSRGLKDTLAGGKTLLTEEQARAIVAALQSELKERQLAQQRQAARARAENNEKEGEAFLAENKAKEGVVTLESGLQYKVLKSGDGKKPTLDDTVVCNYRGTLIDGKEFDSSYKRNQPATFAVKKVIKGWTEALQHMPVGSKWQLYVPSDLAYGERGAGRGIGPNATLIFEVELLAIKEPGSNDKVSATKN
jgi:FKBP-type peptidyl-prolyl cis-trans isomerase